MDCEFFRGGFQAPPFIDHAEFKVKQFSKFFCLQSTLDSEFFRGSVQAPTFFGHAKFEVKIFSEFSHLQSTLDSKLFSRGGTGHQLFFIILNLRSKFFRNFLITECSGL